MIQRRKTRAVHVGKVTLGGGAPIAVQSMNTTDTRDVRATVDQIHRLEAAGCEIARVAVPDLEAASRLGQIRRAISIPLVADVHFDYRLALRAADEGVDELRLNPGNIGARWKIEEVVRAAKVHGLPIRIGVNSGSLEEDILERAGFQVTPEALVESGLRHIAILEDLDFHDIIVSVKSTDVRTSIAAYRKLAPLNDYPLHLGVTEAGRPFSGIIKSAAAFSALLLEGIGDTVRVSLSAEPEEEVRAAFEILKALKIRQRGINLIACPTCGRIEIDVIGLAERLERRLAHIEEPVTVALLGCVVNGPGEAREADVGIAGGKGVAMLVRGGAFVRKIREDEMEEVLVGEVERIAEERRKARPVASGSVARSA